MGLKLALVMGVLLASLCGIFYWYYNDTQARIATLRENTAKLEVAVQTSESSLKTLQAESAKAAELNMSLQKQLQKAEAYGDDLRNKLQQLDLVQDALKDPEKLEGKMNGATANIWRDIMRDSGDSSEYALPKWLQQTRETDRSGNTTAESADTTGSQTEASPAN
jgi:chromosome segregation ATPase